MKLTTEQRSELLSELASSEAGFNETLFGIFLTCYNILLIVLILLLHRIRLKDCKNGIRTF